MDELVGGQPEGWFQRNWLFLVVAACSTGWLGVTYLLLSLAEACAGASPDVSWYDVAGTFQRSLTCRPSNEIGDFLAGAFSPLAFFWLFTAVILQRNELSAQRNELSLARAVSVAQTREARKNVKLLDEQTRVFKAQRDREDLEAADRDIQLLSDVYAKEINGYAVNGRRAIAIKIGGADQESKIIGFLGSFPESSDAAITLHRDRILDSIKEFDDLNLKVEDCSRVYGGWIFKYLSDYSDKIADIVPRISLAKRVQLEQAGLFALIYRVRQLRDLFVRLGDTDVEPTAQRLPDEALIKCDP